MEAEKWDRVQEHIRARQFELGARLPLSWKSVSLVLKHAADRLYDLQHDATLRIIRREAEKPKRGLETEGSRVLEGEELEDPLDSQLISTYYLLMGYAIENLLKGILMIQHPEYFKANSKMTDIKSHDLSDLCKCCDISIQQEEADLLDKLTTYVKWMGKYPIPLEAHKMWPMKKSDGTWKSRGEAFRGRQTQEELNSLYAKILDELERQRTACPDHETSGD
jgi:hypothetical protein